MTNEALLQTLIAANLSVSIIGGGILVKWLVRHIRALEGTVKAQGETLATVGKLNDTLVNVFKALDPDRWAREVTVHKELADRKADALVEEAERRFRDEKAAFSSQTVAAMERFAEHYGEAVGAALRFMPWVPKNHRALVIAEMELPDDLKRTFTDVAAEAPDWSVWSAGGVDLGSLFRSTLTHEPADTPHGVTGKQRHS